MKTIEELSDKTFYQMENYSQLIIDLVEEVEEEISDGKIDGLKSKSYEIGLILEIIDKTRIYDIEALELLLQIIDGKISENLQ
jgi:hypothetical protein